MLKTKSNAGLGRGLNILRIEEALLGSGFEEVQDFGLPVVSIREFRHDTSKGDTFSVIVLRKIHTNKCFFLFKRNLKLISPDKFMACAPKEKAQAVFFLADIIHGGFEVGDEQ